LFSCANAFAGVCEYLIKRYTGRHIDVSRLFIYYNAQIIGQRTLSVTDEGANQKEIALGLRKYGVCEENTWSYEHRLLNKEPSAKAYEEASKYTVVPLRIRFDVQSILTCLHNQIPVIVDIKLINHVGRQVRENQGFLTIPDLDNTFIKRTNSHSVLIVGYNQQTKHFIVRNSWGKDWVNIFSFLFFSFLFICLFKGKEGYFHMPFDYITEPRLIHSHDGLWTIRQILLRTHKLPTVRQLALSNTQLLTQRPTTHIQQSQHHHHHRHKFL
jgi:hypothetical protein